MIKMKIFAPKLVNYKLYLHNSYSNGFQNK